MFATIRGCQLPGSYLVSEPFRWNLYCAAFFHKEWTIINGGTCPWTDMMVFKGRTAQAPKKLPSPKREPGFYQVSIKMTARIPYVFTPVIRANTNTPVATFTVKIATERSPVYAVTSISSNLAINHRYVRTPSISTSHPAARSIRKYHNRSAMLTDTSFGTTAAGTN